MWSLIHGNADHLNRLSFLNSKDQFLPSEFDATGFAAAEQDVRQLTSALFVELFA